MVSLRVVILTILGKFGQKNSLSKVRFAHTKLNFDFYRNLELSLSRTNFLVPCEFLIEGLLRVKSLDEKKLKRSKHRLRSSLKENRKFVAMK